MNLADTHYRWVSEINGSVNAALWMLTASRKTGEPIVIGRGQYFDDARTSFFNARYSWKERVYFSEKFLHTLSSLSSISLLYL